MGGRGGLRATSQTHFNFFLKKIENKILVFFSYLLFIIFLIKK
jgi:hypothetical protein